MMAGKLRNLLFSAMRERNEDFLFFIFNFVLFASLIHVAPNSP